MPDVVDKPTRSRMMSGIRGRNTRPELTLRKALHRLGFRYRLHGRKLPGRPDLVFPKYQAVVFVHGCFWHRHKGCSYTTTPASNAEFWQAKFAENTTRDARNIQRLRQAGWRIGVVWECVTRRHPTEEVAAKVAAWLKSDMREWELPEPSSDQPTGTQASATTAAH